MPQQATQTDDSRDVPHERYEASNKKAYGSQQACADAWAEGQYPTHNTHKNGSATLYSSENFRGVQRADGSGRLIHYRTTESIRTRNGLIIDNIECWSSGFAHCSPPSREYIDGRVPLSTLPRMLDSDHHIYDIQAVHGDRSAMLIDMGDYGILVGRDSTSTQADRFMFRVSETEMDMADRLELSELIDYLLTPKAVRESNYRVVPSNEYAQTKRLSQEALDAHKQAGGNTVTYERWGREYEYNMQYYRADLQGKCIVRQGEWFFIPETPPFSVEKGVPHTCESCGAHSFTVDEYASVCTVCDHVHGVPHFDTDNRMGSHTARDLIYHNDDTYVRGMVKHDRNEHDAINLGDIWHKAVTHDRDVLSFRVNHSRSGGVRGYD